MTRSYMLELPYPASTGNHSVRHARGLHYLTASAKAYRVAVAECCHRQGMAGTKLGGPLEVTVNAWPPDAKARDDDNLLKPLKDALTKAGVWKDDSNRVIRRMTVMWHPPVNGGKLLIELEAL